MNYLKILIIYFPIIIYAGIMYYLSGYYGILKFIFSLIIYTIVFFGLHYLWTKFRKKQLMYFSDFILYFTKRVSFFLIFLTLLFGGGAYLLNEIFPASMTEYTITNGDKIVKFQSMSHIGTKQFYDKIVNNITNIKNEGGVYFYEGVKPGSDESLKKFNKAIGIKFDGELYKNFSKLYGVENQDNSKFMGLVNDLDFNVDINMDQLIELYEERTSDKEDEYESKLPIDANKVIIKTLSELNERQLKVLVYINQAILNFIIGNESTQTFLTNNFTNKDLFDVILGERNIVIKDAIMNSEYSNIYITYGALHFRGTLDLLKKDDPKWQTISIKKLYPIKN